MNRTKQRVAMTETKQTTQPQSSAAFRMIVPGGSFMIGLRIMSFVLLLGGLAVGHAEAAAKRFRLCAEILSAAR